MTRRRARESVRRCHAFAPAHITGVFSPELGARDPRARGSRGAGIVLELGVIAEVEWDPTRPPAVSVTSDLRGPLPISRDVAVRLAPAGNGRVRVRLTHQLPVGQGFGMSAAGALATAFSLSACFRIPRQRAVEVAHLADLYGGGGLGGVAAILGGGLEFRSRAGVPPYGRVVHRTFPRPLIVGVAGRPIPSPSILGDPRALRRIVAAAERSGLTRSAPSPTEFLQQSQAFTDQVGLAPTALRNTIQALRREGGWAAQAMFGQSFFTVPRSTLARRRILRWLERRGIRAVELHAGKAGATMAPDAR
ncbi:MAG: hypothetical protein L3K10_01040 [Thermoplasmata archaeon]|nr:hypothetical protein [Thermoplasmata archaeon]